MKSEKIKKYGIRGIDRPNTRHLSLRVKVPKSNNEQGHSRLNVENVGCTSLKRIVTHHLGSTQVNLKSKTVALKRTLSDILDNPYDRRPVSAHDTDLTNLRKAQAGIEKSVSASSTIGTSCSVFSNQEETTLADIRSTFVIDRSIVPVRPMLPEVLRYSFDDIQNLYTPPPANDTMLFNQASESSHETNDGPQPNGSGSDSSISDVSTGFSIAVESEQ